MMTIVNRSIDVKGLTIRAKLSSKGDDYISLTDIAKYKSERPAVTVEHWLRQYNTIEYLGVWEQLHNDNFKVSDFEDFKNHSGSNTFTMSPQKWISSTNAIGIVSKSGRYGGTYAHSDIAFKFAAWLSPEFELYIIKDYQRLKQAESDHLSLDWSARREIAKTNYKVHTDAIKDYLINENLPARYVNYTYANEADLINVALFGITAKDWRDKHPKEKGNIRDSANLPQLIILANLEMLNAEFIKAGLPQRERLQKLHDIAVSQLKSISNSASVKRLQERFDK